MSAEHQPDSPPFRVGNYMNSNSQVYVPTDPFDKCKYYDNLSLPPAKQANDIQGAKSARADLFLGINEQTIMTLRTLFRVG